MAKIPNQVYSTQETNDGRLQLTEVQGITPQVLYTASANDSLIYSIIGTSNASDVVVLYLYLDTHLMGHGSISSGAGHSDLKRTADLLYNLTLPVDGNGNRFLGLKGGTQLKIGMKTTLLPGETVTITAIGEDY